MFGGESENALKASIEYFDVSGERGISDEMAAFQSLGIS